LIIRRLCVLLNAERVYRELSAILEGESDLVFASNMVLVCVTYPDQKNIVASVMKPYSFAFDLVPF
jgi:vacuole morphology and inheritance protein 14